MARDLTELHKPRSGLGRGGKICAAAVAVAAIVGTVVAFVLPDSPRVEATKETAEAVAMEAAHLLKVIVSGKEAAAADVADADADADAEKNGREMLQAKGHRPHSDGNGGWPGDLQDGTAVATDVQAQNSQELSPPQRQQQVAVAYPKVLPPLDAYNTAEAPRESGIYIPTFTSRNYADVWDPVTNMDVPMYWHVPKAGGTTIQDILGHCLGKVQASDLARDRAGTDQLRFRKKSLQVYTHDDGAKYVNVDTTTLEGLQRAKRLDLAGSGLVDVVFTHRFHDVSQVFDYSRRGRAFALFRHPVKRAVSMFFYLQTAEWEPTFDASLKDMTLLQYAHSPKAEENWVVRSLTNEFEDPVTEQHLEVAKEILRRKVLVGIVELFDESVVRFERYFGWLDSVANDPGALRCQGDRMAAGDNRNRHPNYAPGSEEFRQLAARNWADVDLYHYAKMLFREQASLV